MQVGIIIYHEARISPLSNYVLDPGKGEKLIGDHSFEYEWLESIEKQFLFVSFSFILKKVSQIFENC